MNVGNGFSLVGDAFPLLKASICVCSQKGTGKAMKAFSKRLCDALATAWLITCGSPGMKIKFTHF